MNYKRKKTRKAVKCVLCTSGRFGNSQTAKSKQGKIADLVKKEAYELQKR